jgi:hypothetical protein
VSALAEVQESVLRLSGDEMKALSLWLDSQIEPEINPADEQHLLNSLDEAVAAVERGEGISIDEARRRVSSWALK